jgi:hypothetical protein
LNSAENNGLLFAPQSVTISDPVLILTHLSPFANAVIVNDYMDVIAANEPMYVLVTTSANIVIVFIVVLLYKVNYLSRYII